MNNEKKSTGPGFVILWLLAILGAALIIYRFMNGLGVVTNLSDGYPWGFWIAVDIMAGVALTAGGFTVGALAFIFGREKYRVVFKAAILTAFL